MLSLGAIDLLPVDARHCIADSTGQRPLTDYTGVRGSDNHRRCRARR
jgi:hypothetical protein